MLPFVDPTRRGVIAAGPGLALAFGAAANPATRPVGAAGFDFLLGAWDVRHRRLKKALADASEWVEFPGTLKVEAILDGLGDVDHNVLDDPAGRYLATSMRVFDRNSGKWSIYWLDARAPGLDAPLVGVFEGRIGHFYNDDKFAGRPIRVRFTYEDVAPRLARWAQAFSRDKGATWETNWTMEFTRASSS